MKDNSPYRGLLFTLHKSVGLTILALAATCLIWRAFFFDGLVLITGVAGIVGQAG